MLIYLLIPTILLLWGSQAFFIRLASTHGHWMPVFGVTVMTEVTVAGAFFAFYPRAFDFSLGDGWRFAIPAGIAGITGYLLYFLLLSRVPIVRAVPAIALAPVVAVMLGVFILSEPFTWRYGLAIVFAVAAVWLVSG